MSEIPEDGLEFIKEQRTKRELGIAPESERSSSRANVEFGFDGPLFIPGITNACILCGDLVEVPEGWDKPENCWVAICKPCNDKTGDPESYGLHGDPR